VNSFVVSICLGKLAVAQATFAETAFIVSIQCGFNNLVLKKYSGKLSCRPVA